MSLTLFKDPSYQKIIKKLLTLHPRNYLLQSPHLVSAAGSSQTNQYRRRTAGHVKEMSGRANNHHLSPGDGCWKYDWKKAQERLFEQIQSQTITETYKNRAPHCRFPLPLSSPHFHSLDNRGLRSPGVVTTWGEWKGRQYVSGSTDCIDLCIRKDLSV